MADRVEWPDGGRCAVLLTFNVDGAANWISNNSRIWDMPKTFSMGSYGPWRGVPRILQTLEERGLPATFFVPAWTAENWPEQFASILEHGHEVGHRGYLIETLYDLPDDEQRRLFAKCSDIFERLGAPAARGYRAHNGNMGVTSGPLMIEAGYSYSSSLHGDDRPYWWTVDDQPIDLLEIPVRTELDDAPQFIFSFNPPVPLGQDRIGITEHMFGNWEHEFRGYYEAGLCFVLTIDPQFSGKPGRLRRLTQFLDFIKSHDDVWFATGAQIADWCARSQAANEQVNSPRLAAHSDK